jgi:hypothetical protein
MNVILICQCRPQVSECCLEITANYSQALSKEPTNQPSIHPSIHLSKVFDNRIRSFSITNDKVRDPEAVKSSLYIRTLLYVLFCSQARLAACVLQFGHA